jgi:hypothetical protein
MNRKVYYVHPSSPFPYPLTGTHPWEGKVLPSCLSFFKKYILKAQEDFTLVFQTCTYYILVRLLTLLALSLSPCSPITLKFTVHYIIFTFR